MTARFIVGDTRTVVARLPANSVDLVVTSPPFLALRSYLPMDHPDKHAEIGSARCPADWLDTMLDLTEDWARVLTPHGSLAVEIGDTYSGSGGAGGDYDPNGLRAGQAKFSGSAARRAANGVTDGGRQPRKGKRDGWPLAKSLCMVPALYSSSLAYGWNMLNPERRTPPWRVRNVIRWVRPNPPVGALGDKVRPATTEITVACKSATRWFDLDAVRTPLAVPEAATEKGARIKRKHSGRLDGYGPQPGEPAPSNPAGAPPLDWWNIPPGGFSGSHYAVFPTQLVERLVQLMCPCRVCVTCGQPSRRLHTENADYEGRAGGPSHNNTEQGSSLKGFRHKAYAPPKFVADGWTTCGCPGTDGLRLDGFHTGTGWRPGVVLDPFGGSGTTAVTCTGHGRDSILIDIDERNADLARERVGMWLDIEDHRTTKPAA